MSADPLTLARSRPRRRRRSWSRQAILGGVLLTFVVLVAVLGPLFAPHSLSQPIGIPASGPSSAAPLGTDGLGRDVLSRVLYGGLPVLWTSLACVVGMYVIGGLIGLLAGLSDSLLDPILMRSVDVLIVFPPLVLLLVLIAGAGSSNWVIILGVVLVLSPGVARIVRAATLEIATKGYIEAAVARGERTPQIMFREVLPNIMPVVVADAGVRFLGAIFLIASLDFLGVGSQPPAANWGLMIAENREILSFNVWGVVAPALLLSVLTIAVNLLGNAYTQSRSGGTR